MTQVSREVTGRIFDPDHISNATNQLAARITNLEGTVFNADGFSRAVRYALGSLLRYRCWRYTPSIFRRRDIRTRMRLRSRSASNSRGV